MAQTRSETRSLTRRDLSRRDLMAATAGLSFAFGLGGLERIARAAADDRLWPNWWLNIAGDGILMLSQAVRRLGRPTVSVPSGVLGYAGSFIRQAGVVWIVDHCRYCY